MKTVAIIQARMGSTRLPGKVLADLGGRPVLSWVVDAAKAIPGVNNVVVATTDNNNDDPIVAWCETNNVACRRGSEDDVLARFGAAAKMENAAVILRLTADCPLLDPQVAGQVLTLLRRSGADYVGNAEPATWPDGLDCEAFSRSALDKAVACATLASEREHVTSYIKKNRMLFRTENLTCPIPGLSGERWTLDDEGDFRFLSAVVARLTRDGPPSYIEVLSVLDEYPEIRDLNTEQERDEGYAKSVSADPVAVKRSYVRSSKMLEEAERVIPLGSQTFSKSYTQYPQNQAPLYLTHGQGGRVWDVDGNEYVDLVSGLLCIGLGYRDPYVDEAIRRQMSNGISFSLATELEKQLADHLVRVIPCAEKVRFGKNGTDATSAAVRLSRAFTGRDRIAVCGYHGWQDWYVGSTTRDKGVPAAVRGLTHSVPFGDLEAVDALLAHYPGEFAALIMEPMNKTPPPEGYLEALKDLLHSNGSLLVFDEMITGFRFSLGGAQEHFGVTPDLAAFGKAMGNGMPISSIMGRADVMAEMEEIFFSGTFGGETLSLAAAIAVIEKIEAEPVIETLWQTGNVLAAGLKKIVSDNDLDAVIDIQGLDPWRIIGINHHPAARPEVIRTFLLYELLRNGVLTLGTNNVCFAHTAADVTKVLSAYEVVLPKLAEGLDSGLLEVNLPCPVIEPVFTIR